METTHGMVQVFGQTFRIVRMAPGEYRAVRILDDLPVGTFCTKPKLHVTSARIDPAQLLEIARSAVKGGKVSWARPLH